MILTNGCSFTEGYNLPEGTSWPSVLAAQQQTELTNLAIGGGSNHRIFRTTIEYFNTHPAPDLVVIGWTATGRDELSSSAGSYLRVTNLACLPNTAEIPQSFDHVHKFWLTELYNEYLLFRDWIHNILHLQQYFKQQKVKFLFFCALDTHIREFLHDTNLALELADQSWQWRDRSRYAPCKDIHAEYKELKNLVNQIDLDHWVMRNQYSMQHYLMKNKFVPDSTYHFLEDGHKFWANVISQELK